MTKKYAIGADIGGSHISTVLVNVKERKVFEESFFRQSVDNKGSAQEILKNWSVAIHKTLQHIERDELMGIGFAMPGPFDYETGISLIQNVDKYEGLFGVNVGDELRRLLDLPSSLPFRYLNDAMSFAVGESWIGNASLYKNVVAITLGTGFGSAFLSQGIPVIEGERVPKMGYVYQIPYKNSIADDYFSTRWFIKAYEERTGEICNGVKEIAAKAQSGGAAKKLFEDFGSNLGNFMIPLLKTFETDCLVIGGNITGAWSLFGPQLESTLKKNEMDIEIVLSELMESAAMAGSARLMDEAFWSKVKKLLSKI